MVEWFVSHASSAIVWMIVCHEFSQTRAVRLRTGPILPASLVESFGSRLTTEPQHFPRALCTTNYCSSSTSTIFLTTASIPSSEETASLSANIGEHSFTSSWVILCHIGNMMFLLALSRVDKPFSS